MDSTAYTTVGLKLFGRDGLWSASSRVTRAERRLLEQIGQEGTPKTDDKKVIKMPPGPIPNPTKKKIRPSSAAANLQTHHTLTSGLYDNVRPTTAAPKGTSAASSDQQRPKTQAAGPRRPWQGPGISPEILKPQRRLTLGAVDGIAETETAQRAGNMKQPMIGKLLKGKVCIESLVN